MLKYEFDHKRKLIIETARGEIRLTELIEHEKTKFNDPEHNDSYSIFVDLRNSKFVLTDQDKEMIFKLIKEYTAKINAKRKLALLTYSPEEVVTSELLKRRMSKLTNLRLEIFSTENAAYKWLSL
ncbi:MAG: hypothetical protein C0594_07600 [Marinilabiliales bacterium]|mgnify:CR=1 FL=1|nr:MAG: hypothetical protein C0594_07600 [Marinilabiliales bacterium]